MIRSIFAALIAVSIAVAPIGAALAAAHASAMTGMEGCDKSAADDCPCCDEAQCASAMCMYSCFQAVGALPKEAALHLAVSAFSPGTEPERPPDNARAPPHPPPRI